MKDDGNRYASETQLILARLYGIAAVVGLGFMAVAFVLYVSGVLDTRLPAGEVASYWHLDAESFADETGTAVGWEFLYHLNRGESLSFASLVYMALSVIISMTIMIVTFIRKKKLAFAMIALLQTIVLVIAATGIAS